MVAKRPWHVYAKASFHRGEFVMQYLGRYTHRVGLANSRLLSVSPRTVTFRTKGHGTTTVTPVELLRRFVQHVLPDRFHKIRHIGLYGSPDKLERAHQLLGSLPRRRLRIRRWQEQLLMLTGRDVLHCPHCSFPLCAVALPKARAPPEAAA
jgi:hypothetical protein